MACEKKKERNGKTLRTVLYYIILYMYYINRFGDRFTFYDKTLSGPRSLLSTF